MLTIRLLGEQQVAVHGGPLQPGLQPRTLGLLAYLILHADVPQHRQRVAGLFWPDSSEGQARTNLRRQIHQLRTILPEPDRCLLIDTATLCWRAEAPCDVDLVDFQVQARKAGLAAARGDQAALRSAGEQAVAAYGGEFLPSLYDDWVIDARRRLHRLCVELLDLLAPALAGEGDLPAAIRCAERRIGLEPLDEAGYRVLMTWLAQAGNRALALRTFHRCAAILERELGVEPDGRTASVYRRLFQAPPKPVPGEGRTRRFNRLVGRCGELSLLKEAWSGLTRGADIVVIAGEAGVGKTRLVEAFAHAIGEQGHLVLRARCFLTMRRVALSPVAEWLRAPDLRGPLCGLSRDVRGLVARLAPGVGIDLDPGQSDPLTGGWQRRVFFEALVRALCAAGRPTLLLLDDLQWCDDETLAWLEFLQHFAPAAPVLLVAMLRSEELEDHPGLVDFCRRLQSLGRLRYHEVAPLGAEQVGELATAVLGRPIDSATARKLEAQTGGFPLFIVEALHQGRVGASRGDAVLATRFAQLGAAADDLAGLAAVVGRDFSLELLAAAGGLDEGALVAALDELWRRRLICEHTPSTYHFSHDLLRETAYRRLSPPQRRLLHCRIADALARLHAGDIEAVAARIAEHLERGGREESALPYHAVAAVAATSVYAFADVAHHYGRALELLSRLPPGIARDRRELELSRGLVPALTTLRGYAAPEVGEILQRTVALAKRLEEPVLVLRGEVAIWAHLFVQGRIVESRALSDRLVAGGRECPQLRGAFYMANGGSLTSLGSLPGAVRRFAQAERFVSDEDVLLYGFRTKVMGRAWQAHALWLRGRSADATRNLDAALALADQADRPFDRVIAGAYGAITSLLLGEEERTARLADSVRTLCERHGIAYYAEWGRILEGRLAGGGVGETMIREGMAQLERDHCGTRMPFWMALLAEVLAGSGNRAEAARVLADARTRALAKGDRWWLAELWRLDADLHPPELAEVMLDRALAVAMEQGAVALMLRAATGLADRKRQAGKSREAAAVLAPVRDRARGCNPLELDAADALLRNIARMPGRRRASRLP